jgi:hypothetical protein
MKQRMSRTHKHRKGFKIDCLLDRINMKNREIQPGNLEGYMTLTFLGFYDKKGNFFFSCIISYPWYFVSNYLLNAVNSVGLNEENVNEFVVLFLYGYPSRTSNYLQMQLLVWV